MREEKQTLFLQHLQQSSYQISVQATLVCSFTQGFPALFLYYIHISNSNSESELSPEDLIFFSVRALVLVSS